MTGSNTTEVGKWYWLIRRWIFDGHYAYGHQKYLLCASSKELLKGTFLLPSLKPIYMHVQCNIQCHELHWSCFSDLELVMWHVKSQIRGNHFQKLNALLVFLKLPQSKIHVLIFFLITILDYLVLEVSMYEFIFLLMRDHKF